MKTCRDCGRDLPLDEFYTHPRMADGHLNKCKDCVRARVTKHREKNIERIRAYDRLRGDLPHRKADRQARAHKYVKPARVFRERHPDRYEAHRAVNNAIAQGKLIVQPCERCSYGIGVQAHHEDYSKPLDVNWLCRTCHGQRHREINAERRQRAS